MTPPKANACVERLQLPGPNSPDAVSDVLPCICCGFSFAFNLEFIEWAEASDSEFSGSVLDGVGTLPDRLYDQFVIQVIHGSSPAPVAPFI
jgi:hypothetical protein